MDKNSEKKIKLTNNKEPELKTEQTKVKETRDNPITLRATDYSKWYLDVIAGAELSDNSPVKGCMVIRPNGYAIWENMHNILDEMFKNYGIENAYFPLLIPKSFFEKEAKHVEGFAKECAVVTHHRLEQGEDGKLIPAGKLEEPLIIRPTSETIIYDAYSRWVQTYKDLPILINQWANVVRMEMRTRPFLRTTEFLWQEGHTAHATKDEADQMALQMLDVYGEFIENFLAIPVIKGKKTESEKFAGADYTTTIETMMQDGKVLQAATSHMLGQNFAKVFEVKFLNRSNTMEYVYQTSWGITTRMIGALVMVHSDDKGLVLPPKIAPTQVVIIPIWGNDQEMEMSVNKAKEISTELTNMGISVKIDDRDGRPGPKFYEWERKGIPLRLEIGPKDIAKNTLVAVRRDSGEKQFIGMTELSIIATLLSDIQTSMFEKAKAYRDEMTSTAENYEELKEKFSGNGTGFIYAHWCGDAKCEAKIKEDTSATIRCIAFDQKEEKGNCVCCGKNSSLGKRVIFAKAY